MNDENTNLRRLTFFDAVCRAGGIGQAAAAIGMTQPAVSQAIKRLEQSYGAQLFARGHGGCELTDEGALLQRRMRRMFSQIEAALAALPTAARVRATDPAAVRRHLTDAQLRCHIAIAHCGSAVAAARQLGISQVAVHRAARELEDTVGVALYRRRVHNVSVNTAGLALARKLGVALHEIAQATDDLAAARGQASGQVKVGMLPLMPQRLLARAIGRLRETYPEAAVTIHEGPHSQLLGALEFGQLDVIVGALRAPRLVGPVLEIDLFDDPYVVVVRRGHALAGRARVSGADLAAYDWVVPQQDMPRRAAVEAMLATLPRRPRVAVETSSLAMMMSMLEESDCISLLSRSHILYGSYRDDVVTLKVPTPSKGRTVGITTRAGWLATPVQQAFIDRLNEQCRLEHAG
jgi:LysR family transcriptional regulator of gallate degradation